MSRKLAKRAYSPVKIGVFVLMVATFVATVQAFDPNKTPASPVPASRYPLGELNPVDILGDTTFFNVNSSEPSTQPFYFDVDSESGASKDWLFAATGRGMEVWDITDPEDPDLMSFSYGVTEFPFWGFSDTNFFIKGIDAPPGQHNIVAMSAIDLGMLIWDTTNKGNPDVYYQDQGTVDIRQVWAMRTTGGINYALGGDAGSQGGIKVYDMDRAESFNGCLENSVVSINCSLVYRGRIGSQKRVTSLHGASNPSGSQQFVAARWQVGANNLVEIWDVSNPLTTLLPGTLPKLSATFPRRTLQAVLWEDGGQYFLAGLEEEQVAVYNVSCVTNAGGACNLGSATIIATPQPEPNQVQSELSFARSADGTPFVYVGNSSTGQACVPQREYLLDVSLPIDPANADVTPAPITDTSHPDGPLLGYWGWYYEPCSTGFNNVSPRRMTFRQRADGRKVMYRAAYSLLDSHEVNGGGAPQPPVADFSYLPNPVFEGQAVSFTDESVGNPAPDQWSWTFEDGSPPTSSAQNPSSTFTLDNALVVSESKTVTLVATNSAGSSPIASKEVIVFNPRPNIDSVTANVTSVLECSEVTFSANGVTGNPSPTLVWTVNTMPPTNGGNVNPFVWSITPGTTGNFQATATATNNAGSAMATSPTISVAPLPALAFTGPGNAPTVEDISGGTVEFLVQSTGATEWNWNFGDGTTTGWISDPVTGPNPIHTYATSGTFSVTVQIRNCNAGPITSNAVNATVMVEPLAILSFSADCIGVACFLSMSEVFDLIHTIQGTPDSYEYDWDGDGIYEDIRPTRADTHAFCSSGNPMPALRIRRGNEPPVVRNNSKSYAVSGGSVCSPPATPNSLTATAGATTIQLGWSNSAGETEYRVLRSTDGTVFKPVAVVAANVTTFNDTGVEINVLYSYRVQAFAEPGGSTSGASGFSNTATAEISDPPIFSDGFESGDTSAWDTSISDDNRF